MKKIWITLLMVGSISASANSNMASILETDCPDCSYPPVRTTTDFTYAEAAKNFAGAKPISPAALVGNWKHVAGAQIADVFGGSALMGYNADGIKPSGGEILTLEVSTEKLSGGFFENDPKDLISVKIINLATDPQGPYDVTVNEAGQACFSTKAYDETRMTKAFYAFECRKVAKNSSKILCAVTYNSNGEQSHPNHMRYDGKIGLYLGFVRN